MIQFNLLPDVKLQYMRAKKTKRMVVVVSSIVAAVSVGIMILLLLVVFVVQNKYMRDLSTDIVTYSKNLKTTPDLDKILTVQNQLNSLSGLHQKKVDTTKLVPYLKQLTPAAASVSSLTINFETNTITITGSADSLSTVNTYVDTLKFTEYTYGDTTAKAFPSVVLTSFGRADKGASYTIDVTYDPLIFSTTEEVTLSVPAKVTTRSETEKPAALFEAISNSKAQ